MLFYKINPKCLIKRDLIAKVEVTSFSERPGNTGSMHDGDPVERYLLSIQAYSGEEVGNCEFPSEEEAVAELNAIYGSENIAVELLEAFNETVEAITERIQVPKGSALYAKLDTLLNLITKLNGGE